MTEAGTRTEVGLARGSTTFANSPHTRFTRRDPSTRLARAHKGAAAAAMLLLLAGCSAHVMDSVKGRLPSEAQEWLTPEVTEAIRSQTDTTLQTYVAPAAVDQLGQLAFRIQLATVKTSNDAYLHERVERVRSSLVTGAGGGPYADAARTFAWEVQVIEDDDVNAFAVPGGKIGITTGLLQFTKEDDALLAVALGHELVHAMARHAAQRINQDLAQQLEFAATGLDLDRQNLRPEATVSLMVAMGIAYEGTVMIPFVREQELEADREGLLLMARAGYDPHVAVDFWEARSKLAPQQKGAMPEFLAVHPPDAARIGELRNRLPEALDQYHHGRAASLKGRGGHS